MPLPLFCIRCNYDLHSLAHDSNCPECGLPIATTLVGGPVHDFDRRYLRRLGFCSWGMLALLLVILCVTQIADDRLRPDPAYIYGPLAVITGILLLVFSWAPPKTKRDTNADEANPMAESYADPGLAWRMVLRFAAPAPAIAVVLWEIAYAYVPWDQFDRWKTLANAPALVFIPGLFAVFKLLVATTRGQVERRRYRELQWAAWLWLAAVPGFTFSLLVDMKFLNRQSSGSPVSVLIGVAYVAAVVAFLFSLPLLATTGYNLITGHRRPDPAPFAQRYDPATPQYAAALSGTGTISSTHPMVTTYEPGIESPIDVSILPKD